MREIKRIKELLKMAKLLKADYAEIYTDCDEYIDVKFRIIKK